MVALRGPVGHTPSNARTQRHPPTLTKRQALEPSRLRVQSLANDFTSLSLLPHCASGRNIPTSQGKEVTSHPGCQGGLTQVIRDAKTPITFPMTMHLLSAKRQTGHLTPTALIPTASHRGRAGTQTQGCLTLHPCYHVLSTSCMPGPALDTLSESSHLVLTTLCEGNAMIIISFSK